MASTPHPENGRSYFLSISGHRYSLGFGYDYQVLERVIVFTELDLSRQILKRRVFSTAPSVDLPAPVNRWCPTCKSRRASAFLSGVLFPRVISSNQFENGRGGEGRHQRHNDEHRKELRRDHFEIQA
jgi:hypothetical protein